MTSAPVGTPPPAGIEITDMTSDMYYALLYFNAEHWHSDDQKAAEYESASPHEKAFIAKCAELRTIHAVPFVRSLHAWIAKVREMHMDI